jgi:hypothetical protein
LLIENQSFVVGGRIHGCCEPGFIQESKINNQQLPSLYLTLQSPPRPTSP